MKNILFTLALLISFVSFGQINILNKNPENTYEYDKNGKCNFIDSFNYWYSGRGLILGKPEAELHYIYTKSPFIFYSDDLLFFNSDDFAILKENIDTVTNKSVLKKENILYQFEFYNGDNLNSLENQRKNLKRFIVQLDNKYIEKTDKYLKVINTKGRKKHHYEYNVNFDKDVYEVNYFNDGYKEILSKSDLRYELFDNEVLQQLTVCDGNKLINKYYNENGELYLNIESVTEELDNKTEVDKALYIRFYPSGNRSYLFTQYEVIERLLPEYNRYYNNKNNIGWNNNKILEKNSILEVYSEDGIFSIKVVIYNFKINSANQLIQTEGIINGDTINVYKINEKGEKEVYTTMEFNHIPDFYIKEEKSLKRLLKKLNSF
jgi:hypothetical protein